MMFHLFILHGAVERGEARLLATMGCISADAIAPCLGCDQYLVRAFTEIPVGTLKDPGFLVGPHYTQEIAQRFPHQFAVRKDYPDAVVLYRQVLAKQADGSVVVLGETTPTWFCRLPNPMLEAALEDLMVAGRGRPTNLTFDTAYYAPSGMCRITSQDAVEATTPGSKALDGDDKTAWLDKAASSSIQCQYADGRKYLVTSYAGVCPDRQRLPRSLELSGSNDGGVHSTCSTPNRMPVSPINDHDASSRSPPRPSGTSTGSA